MQAHFEEIEKILKRDLKVEDFEPYGLPKQDCIYITGRVCNLSNEDSSFRDDCVGLFNKSEDNDATKQHRVKLNIKEMQTYSFFEGEVVVA